MSKQTTQPTQQPQPKHIPENLRYMREKDQTPVKGKFIFHEVPNGFMEFVFRKYPGEPIKKYSLKDGEIATVPLGVAKHLNTNCSYPTYEYRSDEAGRPQMSHGLSVRRCSFQSLEFIDIDELPKVPSALDSAK